MDDGAAHEGQLVVGPRRVLGSGDVVEVNRIAPNVVRCRIERIGCRAPEIHERCVAQIAPGRPGAEGVTARANGVLAANGDVRGLIADVRHGPRQGITARVVRHLAPEVREGEGRGLPAATAARRALAAASAASATCSRR